MLKLNTQQLHMQKLTLVKLTYAKAKCANAKYAKAYYATSNMFNPTMLVMQKLKMPSMLQTNAYVCNTACGMQFSNTKIIFQLRFSWDNSSIYVSASPLPSFACLWGDEG